MEDQSNGKVTIREVYQLVGDVREELSLKMDGLSEEIKEQNHENVRRDLEIQALKLELGARPEKVAACIAEAIAAHTKNDHTGLTQLSTKVWVMWGAGLFVGIVVAELFIERYVTSLLGF